MWDKRYLSLAKEISTWSKDPSSQIGAVVIGKEGQVLAQGYNGFPRKIQDSSERYFNRAVKYDLIVHAEMNCIYNASLNGVSLKDATIYIHGLPPCRECAKGIIQVGINRVVTDFRNIPEHRWYESCNQAEELFKEAKIQFDCIEEI